jgi:hypothetical protein
MAGRIHKTTGMLSTITKLVISTTLLFAAALAVQAPGAFASASCSPAGSTTLTAAWVVSSSQVISGQTVDATGCDIGIYVSPGTSGVTIKGVTVTGAGQHAIFVQDSNNIWIANNLITGNGAGARPCFPKTTTGCIPDVKPIDLSGTSDSVVINNVITHNAHGGIGITDDGRQNPGAPGNVSGADLPATNIKVIGNTINDNAGDCGIVVAGYNAGMRTNDIWVVNNTIIGQAPGTPIVDPHGPYIGQIVVAGDGPWVAMNNTWVTGNNLDGAILPGIVVHANVFGDEISNTVIKNNVIANPGYYSGPPVGAPGHNPDVPGASDGPTGIALVAEFPPFDGGTPYPIITHTLVDSNTILNSTIGVWMCNNDDTVITNLWGNPTHATAACQVGGTTTTSSLAVNTQASDGSTISGLYTTLWQGTNMIQSCFSPCTFNVQNGQTYKVLVDNFAQYKFNHWSDGTDNASPWGGWHDVTVPGTTSALSLTAIYITT